MYTKLKHVVQQMQIIAQQRSCTGYVNEASCTFVNALPDLLNDDMVGNVDF